MTRPLLGAFIALFLGSAHAAPATLPHTEERILHSVHTGRDYRIQIATGGEAPADGYPVLYILDGDTLFPALAVMTQSWQYRAAETGARPLALVGIGYANGELLDLASRSADYTPPAPHYPDDRYTYGGAELFSRFIEEELKPEIANTLPVNDRQQAILGHSYGGLFALYTLYNHPQHYRHYLISSPSIWWNGRRVLADAHRLDTAPQPPVHIRITAGAYEEESDPRLPPDPERAARQKARGMVSAARDAAARLQAAGIDAEFQLYPQETHGTVMFTALPDYLRFLYRQLAAAQKSD
ncbi:alpha/beta hydrolase-fold protein [uncultured Cardiobacterium sp.]|uniref:alpha/beta hydrolase n=1 Tax=uncultured Cardiobacterium sp. TaxID=417619 RepID=UPI0026192F94|nr:alpha/beta hydrolase-fold protein [uncultured Cardiobacterium sp.]